MPKKKPQRPDKHDMAILRLVKDNGPSFMTHHAREFRAHDLARDGLLTSRMAVYRQSTKTVEGRNQYSLTPKGLEVLAAFDRAAEMAEGEGQ